MPKKKTTKKNEYVTRKELEGLLAEQSKIIVGAVDTILDKRLNKFRLELKIDFNKLDKKIDGVEARLEKKIDNVQTLIDGYVKAQEEFKQEFVIMKEEVRIMKNIIKEKLGIEVKAI